MRMLRLRDEEHYKGLKENRWGIKEVDPAEVRLSLFSPVLLLTDPPPPLRSTPSKTVLPFLSPAPLPPLPLTLLILAADAATSPGLDLLLVPGLAFDPFRRRLGHGRGYYDRYITKCLDYPMRFGKAPPRTGALAVSFSSSLQCERG